MSDEPKNLTNATPQETKASWKEYYSGLASDETSNEFKQAFEQYTYVHTWHNSIRVIEKYTGMFDGARVLDAGCGWGRMLLGILDNHTGLNITAIDLQEDALDIGRQFIGAEKNGNTISWQQADLSALDLPDEEFDAIYSARVFQHLDDPAGGVAGLLKTLKPGGRFLIFLQNRLCPLNRGYYARMYSVNEIKKWFRDIPLQEVHVSTMDFYPGKLSGLLPLNLRMGVESLGERMPLLKQFGGKVFAWGVK